MLWAGAWNAKNFKKIVCFASMAVSVTATIWIGVLQHWTSNDASYISLVTPGVALIGGYIWVRDNLENILGGL